MAEKVYIMVLNWNNWKDTLECLESMSGITYPSYEVVVIDNSSSDDSVDRIKDWLQDPENIDKVKGEFVLYDRQQAETVEGSAESGRFVIIQTGENLGYAGGNNVGIRYALARGDCGYVWILNNDTVVEPEALSALVKCLGQDERIGAAGSRLIYYHSPGIVQAKGGSRLYPMQGNTVAVGEGEPDKPFDGEPPRIDYACGASVIVREDVLLSVGLMNEDYFLYWEDVDWGQRMRLAGYSIVPCNSSRVLHKEGASTGYFSPKADYYWVRNGLRFTARYYPMYLPLVMFSYFIKYTVFRLFRSQPFNPVAALRGVVDFVMRESGKK